MTAILSGSGFSYAAIQPTAYNVIFVNNQLQFHTVPITFNIVSVVGNGAKVYCNGTSCPWNLALAPNQQLLVSVEPNGNSYGEPWVTFGAQFNYQGMTCTYWDSYYLQATGPQTLGMTPVISIGLNFNADNIFALASGSMSCSGNPK